MNKPLWQPTEDKKKNSLLMDFCKFVELNPKSFYSVWKWSVENPKIFWSKFWDFSKIIGDKGKEIINFNEVFNKTRFFQDSKLNYSENILKSFSRPLVYFVICSFVTSLNKPSKFSKVFFDLCLQHIRGQ